MEMTIPEMDENSTKVECSGEVLHGVRQQKRHTHDNLHKIHHPVNVIN